MRLSSISQKFIQVFHLKTDKSRDIHNSSAVDGHEKEIMVAKQTLNSMTPEETKLRLDQIDMFKKLGERHREAYINTYKEAISSGYILGDDKVLKQLDIPTSKYT